MLSHLMFLLTTHYARLGISRGYYHLYIEIVPIKAPCHPLAHACREPSAQLANHNTDPFCARHGVHLHLFSLLRAFFGARFLAASFSTSP
ncbi:hypothetical protein E2C01_033927 [Portunus trituberculatus]|uniref:Uncharacterized protein n=1 Tax=Portunus trituberculatus TaxID=210409 RepID=A0A5B7F1F8_PORTR|nr:hypothetical protein [Portunus trituberculatus]